MADVQAQDYNQCRSDEEDKMKPPPFPEVGLQFRAETWSALLTNLLNMTLRCQLSVLHHRFRPGERSDGIEKLDCHSLVRQTKKLFGRWRANQLKVA